MLDAFFSWYNGLTDSLIGSLALFAVGLILLIKGGDWFVDSATGIAKRFRVPEIIIGATVVSIGTTLPEVMVSATAAVNQNGAIAYGNAIGSIICNTSLIAALTIIDRTRDVGLQYRFVLWGTMGAILLLMCLIGLTLGAAAGKESDAEVKA